jgi:MATE family multidrug resistance protein
MQGVVTRTGLPEPGSLESFRPQREDLGSLVRLALPVAIVQVAMMAMGAVDTIMVGRVSPVDLAAVALGNLYVFGVTVFGMGVLFALDPVISQAVGAGDPVGVARGVQRGGMLSLGLTGMSVMLLLPAGPALRAAGQPEEVVPVAAGYALASIPGVLPFYGFNVLRQSLQAMARITPILVTVLLANLANVFFNWVLIFGNLGFPSLGAVGSGWATSLSRWFMVLTLLGLAWPILRPSVVPFRPEVTAVRPLLRFFRLGAPVGAQQFLEFGVFGAAGLLMGWMGTVAMASHQVALNLAALTFMVPVGVAQATAVLVGQGVGREDPPAARRAAGAGLLVGAGFMAFAAALLLSMPELLARVFTDDVPVLQLAALLIPIAGIFQVFDGLQVVAAGVLRGVGDTRVPMLLNLVGFWLVGLPVSYGLGFVVDVGPGGIWWGLAAGIGLVAVLLVARVRARLGRELRRLAIDDDQDAVEVGSPAASAPTPP